MLFVSSLQKDLTQLSQTLVCPRCKGPLIPSEKVLQCETEGVFFPINSFGYLDFTDTSVPDTTPTEEDVVIQHESGYRVYNEYIKPWLAEEPFEKVLDVGCGLGRGVMTLAEEGQEAYGVDLPSLTGLWAVAGNEPQRFFCADAAGFLPFRDNYFDAIYSLGVIEHIGTVTGHMTLSKGYQNVRRRYAQELLRVLKTGGRILLSCPHKRFPLDIQHDPGDAHTPAGPISSYLWSKGHVVVHKTWGRYYLLSYSEVEELFSRPVKPLPLKGFFGFASFEHKALKPFLKVANLYIERLPRVLRRTPLNPYMLAEVRK
jgi:SAM-dependent methyltransferase